MRRKALLGLIASCTLAACAHQTAPQATTGMAWFLDATESEGAKLAFGAPSSDNVLLMMTCKPRSGAVQVSLMGFEGGRAPSLQLASGGAVARLAAQSAPGLHAPILEATARASDPVLASFARTGQLAVGAGARPTALPAADRAQSRRFVESCRSA